jgi:hypothetical protein
MVFPHIFDLEVGNTTQYGGEFCKFYTSCGDVIVRPIYFNYDWCDIKIKKGLTSDDNIIEDLDQFRSMILIKQFFNLYN